MKHLISLLIISVLALPCARAADLILTWTDNSDNEAGFVIERAAAVNAPGIAQTFAEVGRTAANVTTFRDTGLPKGTPFTYRIRAYNSVGMSAPTEAVTGTTANNVPLTPGKPVIVPAPIASLLQRFDERIAVVAAEIEQRRKLNASKTP